MIRSTARILTAVCALGSVGVVACSSDDDPAGSSSPAATDTADAAAPTSAEPTTTETTTADTVAADTTGPDASDPTTDGVSLTGLLAQVPLSVVEDEDQLLLTFGDLDRAAELNAAERPADASDPAAVASWAADVGGSVSDEELVGDQAAGLLPRNAAERAAQSDEIEAEIGWSLVDVHVFLEELTPAAQFLLVSGPTAEDLERASADPVDGIWRFGEGDDFELDPDNITPARRFGGPLAQGFVGELLAVSNSTDAVRGWVDGDAETLGTNTAVMAVASTLEDADVYSAMLATPPPRAVGAVNRFDAVGIGLGADETGPVATFAYHYPEPDLATEGAGLLEQLISTGTSMHTGQPWADDMTLEDISADGDVVTMTVRPARDDLRLNMFWSLIPAGDNLVSQS